MNKLFSAFLIMTVFCYGVDNSVNEVTPDSDAQTAAISTLDWSQITKVSCTICLDASTASVEEKEAAYQAVESAIASFEGKVPDSISINVGISNLELVDPQASDFSDTDQDHVIAVKDIKILEIVIDVTCDQATQEEKMAFFSAISAVLVDLCNQLYTVASNIHGSITIDSPDLTVDQKRTLGLLSGLPVAPLATSIINEVVGNIEGTVETVASVVDAPADVPALPGVTVPSVG